ncbi:MAG: DNA helicase PcrA [Clostridia bacterium]|nr:DNA helicase PcrA [Clostridia bacterium]
MNLNELNPMQRQAAERLEGPVLILAGAGSGKTRTLTYRVANLLSQGVPAWRILALTFTNKAAREMRERIERLAGADAGDAWIGTFHSICCRILRRDIEKIGYERNFTIYDEDDQQRVIKGLLKELDIDEKALPPRSVAAAISDAKNRLMSPDEWLKSAGGDYRNQKIHDLMTVYEKRLRAANALDFDDLLMKTIQLFLDHPPVLEYYQQRFRYVHVDEYQDTNYAQYQLVRLITRESRNLCVVGDDDQSIYGWRGADIRNILDFEKDYPDAFVIKLEQNYRSTANILDAANQIIAHNAGRKEKELWTEDGAGEKISLYSAGDEREEAAWIAGRIVQLHREGKGYGNMAILYRMHALSRVLEETLMRAGIPYRVYGGTRFYDRREIRDILAYLRVIENPADDVSLGRIINVPKRAIGDSTVEQLQQFARQNTMSLYAAVAAPPDTLGGRARKSVESFAAMMAQLFIMKEMLPLSQFVQKVIDDAGLISQYEKDLDNNEENQTRIENIREFMGAVTEFEQKSEDKTLFAFLENVALVTELDNQENAPNYVTMMTLHSAKGLEYDAVFMSGMEEGIFPSARSMQEENRLEEERRLCYVGVTRARKLLFMSFARRRMLFNQMQFNAPSCFIREIPKRLVQEEWGGAAQTGASAPAQWGSYGGSGMRPQPRPKYSYGDTVPQRGAGRPDARSPLNIPGVQRGFVASQARNINIQLFKAGDKVMHRKFGKGTVREVTGSGENARIAIVFPVFGEKVFALSIAPIVKVEE